MRLIITISFVSWPTYLNLDRIKDALIHVLRLAGLHNADIDISVK